MEPFLRNTMNASKFGKRVHETGTDSSVGETVTYYSFVNSRCVTASSEPIMRGTVCANVRTYGSVGAVGW